MGNKKFDIRAYVIVVSFEPLLVLYNTGITRVAGVPYDMILKPWDVNRYKHITNTDLVS